MVSSHCSGSFRWRTCVKLSLGSGAVEGGLWVGGIDVESVDIGDLGVTVGATNNLLVVNWVVDSVAVKGIFEVVELLILLKW